MKFLQEITGVQLWLSGTAREAFLRLNHVGLTLSTDAVRSEVDRLRMAYDKELISHKNRTGTYINDQAGPRRRLLTDDEVRSLLKVAHSNDEGTPILVVPCASREMPSIRKTKTTCGYHISNYDECYGRMPFAPTFTKSNLSLPQNYIRTIFIGNI
ncbi:Hypothetical predicted protein [Mytilus galloprovincialis]|uniref:Uncharacterized protein n=1 Tax=Mytilus galloprovincialis TaxID=29158 RepID=A0A8B6H189_MYTGA|nr:Hypothetical predicted protein [Mytilus galloprovincialis]